MIRSFNYTRRQRIRREDIDLVFVNRLDGAGPVGNPTLRKPGFLLPS